MLPFFFLFTGIMIFMGSGSILGCWISLTFSLFSTLFFFLGEKSDSSLKYIFMQEISTWGILFSIFWDFSHFMGLMFLFKLGVPPLHAWFLEILLKNKDSGNWLLGPSKLIPGMFITFFFDIFFFLLFFLFNTITMVFLMGGSSQYSTFVFSSSLNTLFFLMLSFSSCYSSFFYFFCYSLYMFIFLNMSKNKKELSWENLVSLSGLPPGPIFFLKILSLFILGDMFMFGLMFVLLTSAPLFFSYFKIWEKNMTNFSTFFFFLQHPRSGTQVIFFFFPLFFTFTM